MKKNKPSGNYFQYIVMIYILFCILPLKLAAQEGDDALFFDGETAYVNCGDNESLHLVEMLTIEAWIRPTGWNEVSGFSSIVDKEKFRFFLNGNIPSPFHAQSLIFEVHHADGILTRFNTPINSIRLDTWQHVAVTYDGVKVRIYINGEERPISYITDLPSGAIADHQEDILWIADNAGHDRQFRGSIDEVRLWKSARTQSEIESVLYSELGKDETDLAGYWSMRESENKLTDYSGNGNDGIIIGAKWTTAYYDAAGYPKVRLIEINFVTSTRAFIIGEVTCDGGVPLIAKGVCWNTTGTPRIEKNDPNSFIKSSRIGIFNIIIMDLKPDTTYFIRIYASNCGGKRAYSGQASFITPLKPTVTTGEVSSITSHTASCGGIVTDDGKGAIKAKGVCWNISKNPSVDNGSVCSDDGTGIGVFTSEMTNLASGKTYFVRAYATNNAGTAYGDETSFRTLIKPTVTTSAVSNPSSVTAYCGGNITDDGGYSVTAKGVCWSISKSPGIDTGAICTSDGTGKGSFVSLINGLIPNTLYYVRAYAINSGGTAYGNEKVFKTSFILGDINNDGYITLGDAIIGLKILSRINIGDTVISLSSDINEDQKIGFEEIIYILREISRHNDTLP